MERDPISYQTGTVVILLPVAGFQAGLVQLRGSVWQVGPTGMCVHPLGFCEGTGRKLLTPQLPIKGKPLILPLLSPLLQSLWSSYSLFLGSPVAFLLEPLSPSNFWVST